MSKRITSKWTKTTKEAFGSNENTEKGLKAEKLILEHLEEIYDEVIWHENDREKQVAGIDFEFKKSEWYNYYTADVKGNLKEGYFIIIPEEMKTKKNHRMIHVDVNTGWVVEYDRKEMLAYAHEKLSFPLCQGKIGKDGKTYLKLDVWTVKNEGKVKNFRRYPLKKFKPNKEYITKVLDKYEVDIPGV